MRASQADNFIDIETGNEYIVLNENQFDDHIFADSARDGAEPVEAEAIPERVPERAASVELLPAAPYAVRSAMSPVVSSASGIMPGAPPRMMDTLYWTIPIELHVKRYAVTAIRSFIRVSFAPSTDRANWVRVTAIECTGAYFLHPALTVVNKGNARICGLWSHEILHSGYKVSSCGTKLQCAVNKCGTGFGNHAFLSESQLADSLVKLTPYLRSNVLFNATETLQQYRCVLAAPSPAQYLEQLLQVIVPVYPPQARPSTSGGSGASTPATKRRRVLPSTPVSDSSASSSTSSPVSSESSSSSDSPVGNASQWIVTSYSADEAEALVLVPVDGSAVQACDVTLQSVRVVAVLPDARLGETVPWRPGPTAQVIRAPPNTVVQRVTVDRNGDERRPRRVTVKFVTHAVHVE